MKDSDAGPSLFIQFAGQGVKYMDDLRRIYTSTPGIRPFMMEAVDEIKRQASAYDDSRTGFFEKGLDVDQWIISPEKTPDLAYLLSSTLSHPLIYLTQISGYLSLVLGGMDQERLLANTHSATGFSTGIVAAILVSMGLPYDDFIREALKVQAMFFWQGIRCQESMLTFGVNPKLSADLLDSAEGSPSCMASVTNLPRSRLDEAISLFSEQGTVYPAYELFPGRWIIAGLPDDLMVFNGFLKERYAAQNVAWRFIPSTIGAHSPFLAHAFDTSPRDAKALGISFSGQDMKIPVWSNDTGEDLRNLDPIIDEVMRAYFLHPAYFRRQIKPVLPPTGIRYVLDFGPGTGVATLTENHSARSGVQVVRCTIPLGRKILFDEVLPGMPL
jgi:malonyl CoA-acyl carrier protein transacylase